MGLGKNAARQQAELAGTPLEEDADRIVDLMSVVAAELGLQSAKLSPRARAEKALIDAHAASAMSPILGTDMDYSLFTPRGHYTRNEDLTRYFVAMSVLGQHAFPLEGSRMARRRHRRAAAPACAWPCSPRACWSAIPSWRRCGAGSSSPRPSWSASPTTTRPSSWRPRWRPRSRAAWTQPLTATDDETLSAIAETLHTDPPGAHRPGATLGPPHGHPLRHRFLDPRPDDQPQRGDARRSPGARLAARPGCGLRLRLRAGHPGRGGRDRVMSTTPSRWRPCGRPSRRARRRPGARPSTTPGWPPSSRCGCRMARASPTSCAPTPGAPRTSRRASAPTPSSSTTPSSTPSRPSATRAAVRRRARCATGWSRTPSRCSGSRRWRRSPATASTAADSSRRRCAGSWTSTSG